MGSSDDCATRNPYRRWSPQIPFVGVLPYLSTEYSVFKYAALVHRFPPVETLNKLFETAIGYEEARVFSKEAARGGVERTVVEEVYYDLSEFGFLASFVKLMARAAVTSVKYRHRETALGIAYRRATAVSSFFRLSAFENVA